MAALTNGGEATVFLLDDDPAVRQAVSAHARSLQLPLEIFGTASEFLQRFNSARPCCLVVEARLPGMSGVDLLENLHREGIYLAAIAISAKAEIAMAVRAMKAGAITFLEKPLHEQQLWDALQEALRRDADYRHRHGQIARIRRRMEKLTEGESEVLSLLMAGKMNRQIAASLEVSVRTIEVRRAKVMEKMKASSLPELIRDAVLLEIFSEKKTDRINSG